MDRGVPREEEGRERAGNLAFVAKVFPRLSETFVSNEVLALRRAGVPVRVSTPRDMGHEVALEAKPSMYQAALRWLSEG